MLRFTYFISPSSAIVWRAFLAHADGFQHYSSHVASLSMNHHMVFIRLSSSYVLPFSCTTDSRRFDSGRDSEKMMTFTSMKIIFLVIPLHLGWQWCSMYSLGEDSMD